MSNLYLTMEFGTYHMKKNYFTKKCIHRFNVSHCKSTNMKFENWTSIADGYVSCICNCWELDSPLIESWKIFKKWFYLGTMHNIRSLWTEEHQRMLNVELRIINKWTNQASIWFAGKYCQNLLKHVTKMVQILLGLHAQTVQPELVGVISAFLWILCNCI